MRKYLMDEFLLKINERDKLTVKQRRSHEKRTCSDIYYLIKLCASGESEILLKDIDELVLKQLFEISTDGNEVINVEMESVEVNNELDWLDKDPNSFARTVKIPNNNTKLGKELIDNHINQTRQHNGNTLNEVKGKNNINNNNLLAREQFRPQQQKQSKANNNIESSDHFRDKNNYGTYQSRDNGTYQGRSYFDKNQFIEIIIETIMGTINSRQNFGKTNRSYVCKKDNQIIIGSHYSGSSVDIVNNKNKKSKSPESTWEM
jgi:hypothetical protein